jgi:hypothetical protein
MELSDQQIFDALRSMRAALIAALVGTGTDAMVAAGRLLANVTVNDFAELFATLPMDQQNHVLRIINQQLDGVELEVRQLPPH